MADSISKSDLVNLVAEDTGMTKKDVSDIVASIFGNLERSLADGAKVQLAGFGTFEVRERQARTGVKPGTTERIEIPASRYPAFKPSKTLKDALSS